jgi:hypothetical protein
MNEIALRLASRIFDQRLIGNQYRSAFIEAMIEPYIAQHGWRYVGNDWSGWDFERGESSPGQLPCDRLEVKQSAARQTWSEKRDIREIIDRENRTRPVFDIAPRTGYFSDGGSKWSPVPGRCAQTYVFAWNGTYGLPDVDHRNPAQWEFYVVPASRLPNGHRTITLSKIKAITGHDLFLQNPGPVKLEQLSDVIERLCRARAVL